MGQFLPMPSDILRDKLKQLVLEHGYDVVKSVLRDVTKPVTVQPKPASTTSGSGALVAIAVVALATSKTKRRRRR